MSPAKLARDIEQPLDGVLGEDAKAVELLGGIVSPAVVERVEPPVPEGVLVAGRDVTTRRTPARPSARPPWSG